ncbi:isoprenoid synthase domain-containing protein [Aspergillus filifer]
MEWGYPETIPERIITCAETCDLAYFWDDVTDVLGMEKNAEITQDLAIAMLTELQSEEHVEPTLEINKIGVKIVRDLIDLDQETGLDKVISWKAHLDHQAKSTHNNVSFEQYAKHRFSEVGAMWAVELGCWTNDIHISREEKTSVQYLIQKCLTGGMLGNDYYSFNKEFDEHHRTNTLDQIQRREQEFIDAFEEWNRRADPKATELGRYIVMVVVMVSGTMFWMAHAERYHRTDLHTTAKDRAVIVGKAQGGLRVLEGHPPPKGLQGLNGSLESARATSKW